MLDCVEKYYGLRITAAEIVNNTLHLRFASGDKISIFDEGQTCCEHRYMSTDDDVVDLVGRDLRHVIVKSYGESDATDPDNDNQDHELAFVEIGTDAGCVTLVNHNEHNGYYGGFDLTITEGGK